MTNDHDELAARLQRLAEQPVDPRVASAHLTAMGAVAHGRRAGRFTKPKVVAAFVAGLVLGGTGLASAGVMGEVAQDKVADVAAKANVNLPGGTERSTDGCGSITAKNHGDFVKQGGDPKANCGKPVSSVGKGKSGESHGATPACKPPWAGKGNHDKKTPEAVAAHAAACPDEAGEVEPPENEGNGPSITGTIHSDDAGGHGDGVTPTIAGGAGASHRNANAGTHGEDESGS